jgi:tRNA (guanine-N7-)-methyltransferase
MKGQWAAHFGNDHPITLELACGRGEYTIELARSFPNRNFIGVDIKGARIWQGAKIALEEKLNNVAFLRTRIEMIHYLFDSNEVDEIWITFPDPFLRKSKANKRLTSMRFMDLYKTILRPDGIVQLKTDDDTLYDFTVETWHEAKEVEVTYENDDIYAKELDFPELVHKTYYERKHLQNGLTIKYIRARFC